MRVRNTGIVWLVSDTGKLQILWQCCLKICMVAFPKAYEFLWNVKYYVLLHCHEQTWPHLAHKGSEDSVRLPAADTLTWLGLRQSRKKCRWRLPKYAKCVKTRPPQTLIQFKQSAPMYTARLFADDNKPSQFLRPKANSDFWEAKIQFSSNKALLASKYTNAAKKNSSWYSIIAFNHQIGLTEKWLFQSEFSLFTAHTFYSDVLSGLISHDSTLAYVNMTACLGFKLHCAH